MTTKPRPFPETRAFPIQGKATQTLELVILSGSRKGVSTRLTSKLTVGKSDDNDIVLSDDTVSRNHCEFTVDADGVHVRDLNSTNGVRLEGTRIKDAVLSPGAVVRIGEVDIALRASEKPGDILPSDKNHFGHALGASLSMRVIFGMLERIAATDATVLLEGETGTGKDVLARSIAEQSKRAKAPFVIVDCGAVTYSLIESELFGHERGAFTGAVATRKGAFEIADGGTLFLDEVGELPVDVQPKLLRVLETGEFRRVGSNKPMSSNVRVIAATKRDLKREVALGKFREDLYFRLAVVPVLVPPLRSRRDDIPMLAEQILRSVAKDSPLALRPETIAALVSHDWPGNVRELRNVLERAAFMANAEGSHELGPLMLMVGGASSSESAFSFEASLSYRDTRARFESEFESKYVAWLLGRHNGNVSAAAREARMDRKHLSDIAKKHGLRSDE